MQIQKLIICGIFVTVPNCVFAEENAVDWTGKYAGVFIGTSHTETKLTPVDLSDCGQTWCSEPTVDFFTPKLASSTIGGIFGYNKQVGQLVFGYSIEANLSGNQTSVWNSDDVITTSLESTGIVSGRVGYAFNRVFVSLTGGFAAGNYVLHVKDSNLYINEDTPHSNGSIGEGSDNKYLKGLALGISVDYAIDPKWTLGVDAKWIRFKSEDLNAGGASFNYLSGDPNGQVTYIMSPEDLQTKLVSLNLKYKF